MKRYTSIQYLILFIIALTAVKVTAASSTIEGNVKDAKTGEPLLGANVILIGTSMGAATDIHGKYVIRNIIPGSYTIRATYIGYETQEMNITIKEGEHIEQDFKLEPVSIEGKTVVVTAQASGQSQAINQQLSSDQIVNVVSAAKIQELPDANAAESVGRLPGVSVLRNGGEGYKVVIRGLSPKYNKITINGIEMGSSNPSDRSTDLSMVSSYMLEGIEVSKTVTPDMDPDVIGGTVNFELREAKASKSNIPQFGLLGQGGYNGLSNAYNKFNNYKYVGSVEDRFMNERLGIFAQIDIERKNLTSNELSSTYTHFGNSTTQYVITGVNLFYIPRDKLRYNGVLNLDYKYPDGKIKFMNFLSSGTINNIQRTESFSIGSNMLYYTLSSAGSIINTISNAADINHQLSIFNLDVKLAHTYSETKSPNNWLVEFSQTAGGLSKFNYLQNVNPWDVTNAADRDFSKTYLMSLYNASSFAKSRAFMASLDMKTNIDFSKVFTGEVKFGGMYRYKNRSYVFDKFDTRNYLTQVVPHS